MRRRKRREPVLAAGTFDPRIPRAPYAEAETHGQAIGVLLDGIYSACPGGDVTSGWDRLPEWHRALFVVEWAMTEIYNGTLHQYFWNSTGDMAALLPDGAQLFGAHAHADLFARALGFFDHGRVGDRAYRQERLEEIERRGELAAFDALTDEFHALEDAGDAIYTHIRAYVEGHPERFFA